ncbi:transporter substrate-binding domain-containing protein [Methyloversatilis sp.]|uniref:transporter substrate-binding domain-containing protein n=1 Tax=Methyloversatilis sp. TaxID=2569862 RepID=UPI002734AF06|nr:transporter substrate-binding domain-containing protein [Methyloversatilis sp.]MDP2867330.1 transporter substrate-binding domain-containing protein [Methyloversatilis sp.]MDP3456954.1 transporter substrate-binding domain-containing protein [Methyloversatilis sp.]MDP3579916.1 transporter substrate-binding domain-containing protein [Methyloversatilis sp.]
MRICLPASGLRSTRLFHSAIRPLLVVMLCVGACGATFADALRYGGDRDFRPFEFIDESGQPQGFQIELIAELARVTGFDIVPRLDDWSAIEADFRAGRLDLIAMSHTRSREQWAAFASAHATPAMSIYHRRDTGAPVSLADLARGVIAVPDSEPMRETRANFFSGEQYRFVTVADHAAALAALRDGSAVFALMPRAYGDKLLASGRYDAVVASDFMLRLQDYGFAVAPENEALREVLNDALKELERSGQLDALRMKWLSSHRAAAEHSALEARVITQRMDLMLLGAGAAVALGWLALRLRRRAAQTARERILRAEAEQALQRAEDRLACAFTHHPDAMLISEYHSGRVLDVNDALCRLTGAEADALIGEPIDALRAFVDPDGLNTLLELMHTDGAVSSTPLRLRRNDGDLRECLVSSGEFRSDGAREVFSIIRDVTDLLRDSDALRAAYDALTESAHRQAEALAQARAALAGTQSELQTLTASISHDLRGPLRIIRGFSSMLRDDLQAGNVDKVLRHAERIDSVARRMDDIIEALTRLACAAQQALEPVRLDMEASAAQAWALLTEMGETGRTTLRIGNLPFATGDEAMLAQVWQNLLGNACKYSAKVEDPRVAIDAFVEDGRQWYRVTDNGAGFDMAYARHLFEPFRRLHLASEYAGSGVGLSVVHRIVRHHGGDIRARGSVGVGAVFEFTLDRPSLGTDALAKPNE